MKKSLIVVLLVTVLAVLLAVPAIADEPAHTAHCVCGGADADCALASHAAPEGEWKAWDGTEAISAAGNYYLVADVTGGSMKTLTATNGVINLCLNGHSFASDGRALSIGASTTVNIMNCQDRVGTLKGKGANAGNSGVIMMGGANSTLNIYDNVHVEFDSTSANKPTVGGAISLQVGTAALNMYGGTITGGTVSQNGGAVCVNASGASFAMYDGTINGGTATGNGGAVYVAPGGAMTMSGGTINGGTAASGGAVHVAYTADPAAVGTLTVSGGTINSGTATTGACVRNVGGSITLSGNPVIEEIYRGGTLNASGLSGASIGITSNAARDNLTGTVDFAGATCFYSTSDSYKVVLESDNKLSLVAADATGYSCICGADNRTGDDAVHTDACFLVADNMWTEVSTITSSTTGYVKLSQTVELTGLVNFTSTSSVVVIDLNGNTITAAADNNNRFFRTAGTLVITDTSAGKTGKILLPAIFGAGSHTSGGILDLRSATSRAYVYGGMLDASASTSGKVTGASVADVYTAGAELHIYGGTLKGCAVTGSGATIKSVSAIYMHGGTVIGGTAVNGGAIYSTGDIYMSGGTITGSTVTGNGGAIYSTGSITMSAGTVNGGATPTTSGYGGGAVYTTGTLDMSGTAKIIGGVSRDGGVVHLASGAVLNMRNDALIQGNNHSATKTANLGGAIYAKEAEIYMYDSAKIVGGAANAYGGAVYLVSTDMTMEDSASVTDGYVVTTDASAAVYGHGSGIFADSGSSLTMSDSASVTNNYSKNTTQASGVYVASSATVTLSGNAKITGNYGSATVTGFANGAITATNAGVAKNLYLPEGETVTVVDELGENANVGVTATVDTAFTGATSAANAQKFHADNILYMVKQDSNGALMLSAVTHCQCGAATTEGEAVTHADGCDTVIYQWQPFDFTAAATISEAGSYYLTADADLSGQLTFSGTAAFQVNIDLNGYNWTCSSGRALSPSNNVTLTISNTDANPNHNEAEDGGVIQGAGIGGSNTAVMMFNGSNIKVNVLNGVTLKNAGTRDTVTHSGVAHITGGELNLYGVTVIGGTVSGDNGGGAFFVNGGTLNVYDSEITAGNAQKGDAIHIANSGTVVLHNTTINPHATKPGTGSAVYLTSGSLTVSGKVIITGHSQNVYLTAGKTITIGDGGVTNDSNIGVTLADLTQAFTAAADADYSGAFRSDNTDYVVAANATNALMLGIKHCVCGDPTAVITESTHACYGGHTEVVWLPWNGTALTTAGNYYLTGDITEGYSSKSLGNASGTVNLCLHGHSITSTGRVFTIASGATVHITNCETEGGNLNGIGGGANSGTMNFAGNAEVHMYDNVHMTGVNTNTITDGGVTKIAGNFYMHGGSITGTTITSNGGAVHVPSGSAFYMYDGTITGGSANLGGAVYAGGTFEMHSGTITGGSATQGGNVCINGGSVTMTGGSITGGKSDKGGGVQVISGAITVSGKVTITGNTKTDENTANNVVINSEDIPITIGEGGLDTESRIGVTSANGGKVVSIANPTAELVACFPNDNDATHWVDTDSAGIYLRAVGQIWHCVCGDPTANITDSNHHCYGGHTSVKWTAYDGSTTFPTSGYIQLTNSFELALTSHIAVNGELAIDLNNCTVTTTGAVRMFKVSASDTVIITDTSENAQGKLVPSTTFTNSYGGVFDMDNATSRVYIYGGILDASTSTGQYGTVAALRVSGASMYIFGGTLTGGTVTGNGAAIRIESGCSVTMTGGIINGGSTPLSGGAVYVNGGELNMSGTAAIIGGESTAASGNDYGGGSVAVANSGSLKMSGNAKISGGTATRVGGVVFLNTGTLDMSGNAQIWGANYTGASTKTGGNKGGAVHAVSGIITMKDDTKILGGAANAQGGSINLESSQMTMEDNATVSGGYILTSDNTYGKGGGIALSASSLTMSDNAIVTGNYTSASVHGSGVHAFNASDCTVTLSGNAKITGNYGGATVSGCTNGVITVTKAGAAKNLYLPAGETVTIGDGGMGAAANVGITMADPSQAFTGAVTVSDAIAFRSDDSAYLVLFNENGLKLTNEGGAAVVGDVLFANLSDALAAITDPNVQYVELQNNVTGDVTVNSTAYLDLAGFNIEGNVTVTAGTLYVFDTATKDYDVSDGKYGKITGAITGLDTDFVTKSAHYGKQHRYIMIDEGNNTYSFHRIYVGIESILLYPQTTAMDYKLNLLCDEVVKAHIDTYGGEYSVNETVPKSWPGSEINPYDGNADEDTRYNVRKVQVGNILDAEDDTYWVRNAEETYINANAFITLTGGTEKITSATITKSLKDVVVAADKLVGSATANQKHALANMYSTYQTLMEPWFAEGSTIPTLNPEDYIAHCVCGDPESTGNPCADAGHKKLSWEAAAAKSIKQSGSYYLTEDFAANNSGQISVGTNGSTEKITVYLDLNGNNWTSTGRAFQVFGNATLVLCNSGEEVATVTGAGVGGGAGGVVQTQPGAVLEMYDRVKLSLTESVTRNVINGGVVYVHDGAKFYMYGGEVAGCNIPSGTVANTENPEPYGGSVYVYKNAEFHMTGGTVSGGKVATMGGNVYVAGTAKFLMSGGTIQGGSAATGGAVYVANNAIMTMTGGTIEGNTTTTTGAVHIRSNGTLNLSGNATITANVDGESAAKNLYSEAYIGIEEGFAGDIGIATIGTFTAKDIATTANAAYFTSDMGYEVRVGVDGLYAAAENVQYSVGYGENSIDPVDESGNLLSETHLMGYGNTSDRTATSIEDGNGLLATCLAVTDTEGDTVLLIAVDLVSPTNADAVRTAVSDATGVPVRNIMISAIHQHSSPEFTDQYAEIFEAGVIAAAEEAMADLAPATIQTTSAQTSTYLGNAMNFVRNISLYENGEFVGTYGSNHFGGDLSEYTTATSHDQALSDGKWAFYESDPDREIQLLKFVRNKGNIIVANFQTHPHMASSHASYNTMVTADLVGVFRTQLESTLNDGTQVMYFSGAGGNLNPLDSHLSESTLEDHRFYGNRLAQIASAATGYETVAAGNVTTAQKTVTCGIKDDAFAGKTAYEVLVKAQEIMDAVTEGTLSAGPFAVGSSYITEYGIYSTYHAKAIINRADVKDQANSLTIGTLSIGNVAFVSAPYEMFDTNGMEIKDHTENPYDMTIICTQANGAKGYIPSALGYDRGGYATDCTYFAAGTGEALVGEYITMLNAMKAVEAN